MGFKPIITNKKIPFYQIPKGKAYKIFIAESLWNIKGESLQLSGFYGIQTYNLQQIHDLKGFKPMTKYYSAFEISKEKAYKILNARANGM